MSTISVAPCGNLEQPPYIHINIDLIHLVLCTQIHTERIQCCSCVWKAMVAYTYASQNCERMRFTYIRDSVNNIITSAQRPWPLPSSSSLQLWHRFPPEIKSRIWCQFYCQFILPVCPWNIHTCREGKSFSCLGIQNSSWRHPAGVGTTWQGRGGVMTTSDKGKEKI